MLILLIVVALIFSLRLNLHALRKLDGQIPSTDLTAKSNSWMNPYTRKTSTSRSVCNIQWQIMLHFSVLYFRFVKLDLWGLTFVRISHRIYQDKLVVIFMQPLRKLQNFFQSAFLGHCLRNIGDLVLRLLSMSFFFWSQLTPVLRPLKSST